MDAGQYRCLVLVFNALSGLLQFYGQHVNETKTPDLFSLRVLEGQLVQVSLESIQHLDSDDGNAFTDLLIELSRDAATLANTAVPYVSESDPELFLRIGYILNQPFTVFSMVRLTEPMMSYRGKMAPFLRADGLPGPLSALKTPCAMEMNHVMRSSAENWLRTGDKVRESSAGPPFLCENISDSCVKYIFEPRPLSLVHLANRAFLTSLLELVHCDRIVEKTNNRGQLLAEFQVELCTNLLSLLEQLISSSSNGEHGRGTTLSIISVQFVCGHLGFIEFTRSSWLKYILSLQTTSGCFTFAVDGACDSEVTFAAAATLTSYLRFLINPGGKSTGSYGIWTGRSDRFSVPLEGRFWKPPPRLPRVSVRSEEPSASEVRTAVLEMDFDRTRLHSVSDVTLYWFLAVLIAFVVVTFKFRAKQGRSKLVNPTDARKRTL